MSEVPTLIDLAMNTAAGQGAIEVQIATCLRTAIMGYQHLIFTLDEQSDYEKTMKLLGKVWQSLKGNHRLPDDLVK